MITYKGIVTEKISGKPVSLAAVVLQIAGTATTQVFATTDTDGSFMATQTLDPGTYTVQAGIAATSQYNIALSSPVPFAVTAGPVDLLITLSVQQS